jgi:3-hydroxy-9,10-secoandrosta-1,3,5(10)-triene-9,17-dione monooxygenase
MPDASAAALKSPPYTTVEQALEAARALAPMLKAQRLSAIAARRLPEETFAAMVKAGMFKLIQPKAFGGAELPYGSHVAVTAELAKACGAAGWVAGVVNTHHWMMGKFDPRVQAEIWGEDPDTVSCSAFAFAHAKAEPVEGGYKVSGRWLYSSGSNNAAWAMVSIPTVTDDGKPMRAFALLPKSDYRVLDNWNAAGLAGSGSHDLEAHDIFVPHYRTLGFDWMDRPDAPGHALNTGSCFRLPTFGPINLTCIGPAIGLAQSALDNFLGNLRERKNAFGAKVAEFQSLQLRVSESSAEIDAATAIAEKLVAELQAAATSAAGLSKAQNLKLQRDAAYIGKLCANAVARLADAQGAGGLAADNLVNIAQADLKGALSHLTMGWDANATPYGKFLLGV